MTGKESHWSAQKRLIMIRHGYPEWRPPVLISLSRFTHMTAEYDAAHLSEKGIRTTGALTDRLPKGLILSSDLPRARETAEIVGGENRNIEFGSIYRELQGPRIAGGVFSELWAPPLVWSLIRCCCWVLGKGEYSETPRAAWNRVAEAASRILKQFEIEESIILVSHGWFMILLVMYLRRRGLIERGPLFPKTGYGAMTEYLLRAE